MILDSIENISHYMKDPAWDKAIKFLTKINQMTEDGEYEVDGEKIFARVMSYETKDINAAHPEAHKKYIDIQAVITGEERVFWYPLKKLVCREEYNETSDVAFYEKDQDVVSETVLLPGYFMIFFPEDAHMPSISTEKIPNKVKKVVIKIAV